MPQVEYYRARRRVRSKGHGRWQENRDIVQVTLKMSLDYRALAKQIHQEAQVGTLATKWQAVRRRDELIGRRPAETAKDLTDAATEGAHCEREAPYGRYIADALAAVLNAD